MPGDDQLVQGLLYDAKATRGALANWMKVNADGTLNDSMSRRYAVLPLLAVQAFSLPKTGCLHGKLLQRRTQLFVCADSNCTADNNDVFRCPRPLQVLS